MLLLPKKSKNSGFTLIELMVAISIVAVLSVLAIIAYSSAQKGARDARRREEISAIAGSIEAKKDVSSGYYSYDATDYSREFVNVASGSEGQDPLGNQYCIWLYTATGKITTPISVAMTYPTTTCALDSGSAAMEASTGGPTQYAGSPAFASPGKLYNAIKSGGAFTKANVSTSKITGWVVCAPLETNTTPFCKMSSSLAQ